MRLRDLFKRKEDPYTKGLQSAEEKNKRTIDIIMPPMDENGRYVPDRSRQGVNLSTYHTEYQNGKK